jgi:hypothetical protein
LNRRDAEITEEQKKSGACVSSITGVPATAFRANPKN